MLAAAFFAQLTVCQHQHAFAVQVIHGKMKSFWLQPFAGHCVSAVDMTTADCNAGDTSAP